MENKQFELTHFGFEPDAESSFSIKIGGTVYEVTTHFNESGKQSVLQQFRDLLLTQQSA
jgi:hypothetical protein